MLLSELKMGKGTDDRMFGIGLNNDHRKEADA